MAHLSLDVLGSVISYVIHDTNVKRELKEYSTRLKAIVEKLQADLGERNTHNNHRTVRGKSKRNSMPIDDSFEFLISWQSDSTRR
jgi:hypothetical protein